MSRGVAYAPRDETWSPARSLLSHQKEAVQQILESIDEGSYVTLLGPHFSGKTLLVQAVAEALEKRAYPPCVYVDLSRLAASTVRGFFGDLARVTTHRLAESTRLRLEPPRLAASTSADYRSLLVGAVAQLDDDLVLLLDHLESLPTDLAQALMTSLRAAYMEQSTMNCRLLVVASGALSFAGLTVGESSPFRGIARRVYVRDLSEAESEALIAEEIAREQVASTPGARRELVRAARGDPTLIRHITRDAIRSAQATASAKLTVRTVEQVVRRFLDGEVSVYAPLQEAARRIEDEPELLRCVLLLLRHGTLPRSELPLSLSPDVDPLYLTGVIERLDGDRYRLRNDICRRFLAERLAPGRVGHLLTMAGEWNSAIDYLESSLAAGSQDNRADLLLATIHSMYASDDLGQAAHYVLRGLLAGFGIHEAQVWIALTHEPSLRLLERITRGQDPHAPSTQHAVSLETIGVQEDRLEARAYREASPMRELEGSSGMRRAIPLLVPGQRPLGVVCMTDLAGERFTEQRERDLQLLGYLNQAARAFQQVGRRTRELALAGRVQAMMLPQVPSVPGWQLAAVLMPARQTAGDFYDLIPLRDGRWGIAVADVADKGMGAALYMALSRTLIRTHATLNPGDPARVLAEANRGMLRDAPAGLFVTVFYGVLEPASGDLLYANAGHPPPLLLRTGSESPEELVRTGMALGVSAEEMWRSQRVRLAPADLLVCYTDGLPDAHSGRQALFGRERVLQVVRANAKRTAPEVQEALVEAVNAFVGAEPQFDDLTLLLLKREEVGKPAEARPRPLPEYPTFRARVI